MIEIMPISELRDFTPMDTGLDRDIRALLWEYGEDTQPREECSRDAFMALLAAVPAMRKTPGLPGPQQVGAGYFTQLPVCATEADRVLCRRHLEETWGIRDGRTMEQVNSRKICCHGQYLDFLGTWEGYPTFPLSDLKSSSLEFFRRARDFSAQFYPLLEHRGFLGWDISECMGNLRAAYACGMIERQQLNLWGDYWVQRAQSFHSWAEYAVSVVCGLLYWSFRNREPMTKLQENQKFWLGMLRWLLDEETAWGSGMWYVPERDRKYLLWPGDILMLLPDWKGPDGCIVSNRITVLGEPVGYCYRERPVRTWKDSGWRFLSRDEPEINLYSTDDASILSLNEVCNYDRSIIPLLKAEPRTAYVRGRNGSYQKVPFPGK